MYREGQGEGIPKEKDLVDFELLVLNITKALLYL